MPIKYRVLSDHKLLFGIFSGVLTPAEYMQGIEELSVNPEFKSNFDRLGILHHSLDLSHFAFEDITKIRDKMLSAYYDGIPPSGTDHSLYRLAAVLDSPMHQMMLKLYGATLSRDMPLPITVKSFPSLNDALIWLERSDLIAEMQKDDWQAFMTPDT